MTLKVLALGGDGIGPEVVDAAARSINFKFDLSKDLLVGATGGPAWDPIVIDGGPEEQDALLKLRHELDVFACVRHE
jgi:isocitrate/isopropylmalate dehydrogenase